MKNCSILPREVWCQLKDFGEMEGLIFPAEKPEPRTLYRVRATARTSECAPGGIFCFIYLFNTLEKECAQIKSIATNEQRKVHTV